MKGYTQKQSIMGVILRATCNYIRSVIQLLLSMAVSNLNPMHSAVWPDLLESQ